MLRDTLRIIAVTSDDEHCVELLLQLAQSLTGAGGGVFALFDSPRARIDVGTGTSWRVHTEMLQASVVGLSEGIALNPALIDARENPFGTVLVAPIFADQQVCGGLWLLFDQPYHLTVDDQTQLEGLADGLSIVAGRVREASRLRSERSAYDTALNGIDDAVLMLDREQQVTWINRAAERLFHLTTDQARGSLLTGLAGADGLATAIDDGDDSWSTHDERVFVPHRTEIPGENDGRAGWVVRLRDVSEFRKLNRKQSEFMRVVAHDVRSPLTSMQGFANMLELGLVGEMNERQLYFVGKILSGISQINSQVENIQDAGRFDPETGFYEMSRSLCDLGEIAHRVVDNYLIPAEKQALTINLALDDEVPIINADSLMLDRAVTNLIDNAIKYTPDGGRIDIAAFVRDGSLVLSVHDTGPGISEANQKLLFNRHVRLRRREHQKVKGTGLGLFIVRSVAQRHGGNAWVESAEGEGSTFFFSVPLKGANLVAPE